MFKNTTPHTDSLNGYQYKIRTGIRTPKGAVNLAYYNVKPLHPSENVVISDTSRFVIENVNQEYLNELIMSPNELGHLQVNGKTAIDSDLFDITNKFKDNTPLYYKYRLYYKHYDVSGSNPLATYNGSSIKLVDINKRPLDRKRFKYDIYLEPTAQADMYIVNIYTSFLVEKGNIYYCMYNAVTEKDDGTNDIIPQYTERINPQPYFEKIRDYVVHTITVGSVNYNSIQVPYTPILDTRNHVDVFFNIATEDGLYSTGEIYAKVINRKYALPHEIPLFKGNNMCVSINSEGAPVSAKELVQSNNPGINLDNKMFVVNITGGVGNTNITTDPSGNSLVYAETTVDTGVFNDVDNTGLLYLPNKYEITPAGFVPVYAVKMKDHRQIKIVQPKESHVFDNWYARVQYGRFKKKDIVNSVETNLYYYIPEYYNQSYSGIYGKPYVDIKDEKPVLLNRNTIKTQFSPLYVKQLDDRSIENILIRKTNIFDNTEEALTIVSWNCSDGTVEVSETLNENDVISIDYTYEEQTYVYRGYIDEDSGVFINLDLNINKYHTYTYKNIDMITEGPTHALMNSTIYIYMRPAAKTQIVLGQEQTVYENSSVLYHTFSESALSEDDILLGKIFLRHNTTMKNINVVDTRTKGGGVIREMSDSLRRELEPESDYYWDIGYFDGTPYSENGVVVVRLDSRTLKDYGGKFTPQEVEAAVNKWVAFGVFAIIEYVSTYSQDTTPNSTMKVESVTINKLNHTPVASIDTYNPIKVEEFKLYYYNTNFRPYGIINVSDKDVADGIIIDTDKISVHPYLNQIEIDKEEVGINEQPMFLLSTEDI